MSGTINSTPKRMDFSEDPPPRDDGSVMDWLMRAHQPDATPRPAGQVMENPSPDFHPAIEGVGGGTRPWSREEFEAMKHGSIDTFLELAQVAGADAPRGPEIPAPGRSLINTRMIPKLAKEPLVGYNPPSGTPRRSAFEDYPNGAPVDEFGNITHSIEGVPLTAKNVAGRREMDKFGDNPDRRVDLGSTIDLAKEAGGGSVLGTSQASLGKNVVGDYSPTTNSIRYLDTLSPEKLDVVITHEVGHLIDNMAGRIRHAPGMVKELETIYHTLDTGKGVNPKVMSTITPQKRGYRPDEVREEHLAEAIRAYIQDPNWIKSVAPRTAKTIREAVNTDKELSKWIQFNTATGLLGGAAAADLASGDDDEKKDR